MPVVFAPLKRWPVASSLIVIVVATPLGLSTFSAGPVAMFTTSLVSFSMSLTIVTRRSRPVAPTGMVTPPAALTHAEPV